MKTRQVDFSRVPNRAVGDGSTISVDTSYVTGEGFAYFETAARADIGKFQPRAQWQILEQYSGRDQALVGHQRWAKTCREQGIPDPE